MDIPVELCLELLVAADYLGLDSTSCPGPGTRARLRSELTPRPRAEHRNYLMTAARLHLPLISRRFVGTVPGVEGCGTYPRDNTLPDTPRVSGNRFDEFTNPLPLSTQHAPWMYLLDHRVTAPLQHIRSILHFTVDRTPIRGGRATVHIYRTTPFSMEFLPLAFGPQSSSLKVPLVVAKSDFIIQRETISCHLHYYR